MQRRLKPWPEARNDAIDPCFADGFQAVIESVSLLYDHRQKLYSERSGRTLRLFEKNFICRTRRHQYGNAIDSGYCFLEQLEEFSPEFSSQTSKTRDISA